MRIGVFGGTFDPPHVAHLIVAETVRAQFGLDRVLWVPNARPPHKASEALTPAHHRLAMTRLAIEGNTAFAVSTVEMDAQGPCYTVDTLRRLAEAHPASELALVIGGDSLAGFGTWRAPEEILRRAPLLVYHRPDVVPSLPPSLAEALAGRIHFAEAPLLGISSTALRRRCRAGATIRYLVPDAVHAYVLRHGLYRA